MQSNFKFITIKWFLKLLDCVTFPRTTLPHVMHWAPALPTLSTSVTSLKNLLLSIILEAFGGIFGSLLSSLPSSELTSSGTNSGSDSLLWLMIANLIGRAITLLIQFTLKISWRLCHFKNFRRKSLCRLVKIGCFLNFRESSCSGDWLMQTEPPLTQLGIVLERKRFDAITLEFMRIVFLRAASAGEAGQSEACLKLIPNGWKIQSALGSNTGVTSCGMSTWQAEDYVNELNCLQSPVWVLMN